MTQVCYIASLTKLVRGIKICHPTTKSATTTNCVTATKQNLTSAFRQIFQAPLNFSIVAMPNVGRVVAISNPQLLKVETGPAVQDFDEAKAFLAFLGIKFINVDEVAKIYYDNIVSFLNANKPEILFTAVTDQQNNLCIVPTKYFYDHQNDMVALLNNGVVDLLERYLLDYQIFIESLNIIFESVPESIGSQLEDFDRCKFKNTSLMEFVRYNPKSAIDTFNYFFKTDKDYSPFVIVSKHEKIFHLDREKNNELWGDFLINFRTLILENESRARKKPKDIEILFGKKGMAAQIQQGYESTIDKLIYQGAGFDKNEMTQAVLNFGKTVQEYHQLMQKCAEENFSKHDLALIDINTLQKHIDVLTEALKIKFDFQGGNAVTVSMLTIRTQGEKLILDAKKSLSFAEIHKIFNETKAALKYLGASKINVVCENTKDALGAYIVQRDKAEHDKQQQAIIDAANQKAREEKERARANFSSSSSSSSVSSTTPLFTGSVTNTLQTLPTTDKNVHYLGKSMGVDLYLYFNPANFIDQIPDVNVFSGDSLLKIADQSGGSGTKYLNLDPSIMLNCQIDGENKALPISYEMKPHGTPERLLCVHLCYKGAVLIFPLIYKKDGLHDRNDITSLQTSSKNKVYVLHLSTTANNVKHSLLI